MDLWLIFLTGLTVSGFGCLAVQGGLLTSTLASNLNRKNYSLHFISQSPPLLAFSFSKLISYTPSYLKVQKGVPVHLSVITTGVPNCARPQFKIPDLNISKTLPLSGQSEINFTPSTVGKFTFTCPLGLYSGTIEVI